MIAKPEPRAYYKDRLKRRQRRADHLVYRAVDERDGQQCQVCGIYCGNSIHRHHIKYRSLGGETTLENLTSLCQKCHRAVHERRVSL